MEISDLLMILVTFPDFFQKLLQFIKTMIFFNKLIYICINSYESKKVVDNYFIGTKTYKNT